jgi:hypothetical protein
MFRTVYMSIIRSFSLYTQQWGRSYRFVGSFRAAGSGYCILILLEICLQTRMTYTTAMCTVKNSWWCTEELSETCRVSFQYKFEKLVHLAGFIIRICHDARSHERKIQLHNLYLLHKTPTCFGPTYWPSSRSYLLDRSAQRIRCIISYIIKS